MMIQRCKSHLKQSPIVIEHIAMVISWLNEKLKVAVNDEESRDLFHMDLDL